MSALVVAPAAAVAPGADPHAAPVLSAVDKRAQQSLLVATWSVQALAPHLPLVFPVDPALPASPKLHYRSAYVPPDPASLPDPAQWAALSEFELALHLIDFSPLEPALAAHYVPSHKGQVPFHPVSLFLRVCLRRELRLGWRALARLLRHTEHGAGWRRHFGFTAGVTPSASGLRHFFQAVGPAVFAALCRRFVALLRQYGLCPEHSTYPGDPPDRGVTVSQDGMLHPARHQHCCHLATDRCFQSLAERPAAATPAAEAGPAPADPAPAAADPAGAAAGGRPCRAREQHLPGCDCATPACAAQCQRASTRDPQARLIHYAGRTPKEAAPAASAGPAAAPAGPPGKAKGTDVFGYRSVAERILDDRFAVAWTATSDLYAANTDERTVFCPRVAAFAQTFPDLKVGEWLDDSGVGYGDCLDAIWELGALRMIDIRADASDRDPATCRQRGYDGVGRPLCPHGYRLHPNGYDAHRRRATYICAQACTRAPLQDGDPVAPVDGCPYREASTVGFVVHVGRTLPDGSVRLARDIPYGSATWQARYGRRNLSESRNGQLAGMGLKRLPSYGLPRNTKEVQVGDFLLNLRTLGRLVRQASTAPPR